MVRREVGVVQGGLDRLVTHPNLDAADIDATDELPRAARMPRRVDQGCRRSPEGGCGLAATSQ